MISLVCKHITILNQWNANLSKELSLFFKHIYNPVL